MKFKLCLAILLMLCGFVCSAQIYAITGVHESWVRNKVLQGTTPIYSFHIGGGVTFRWEKVNKISMSLQSEIIQKGYNQEINGEKFKRRFNYFTFQPTFNYELLPYITLKTGINCAFLINTNVKKGNETYRNYDFGLMGGMSFFDNKWVGFYVQAVYGLTPMLNYYNIDPMGNFNGKINDLKNTCFMAGVKINFNAKKIYF